MIRTIAAALVIAAMSAPASAGKPVSSYSVILDAPSKLTEYPPNRRQESAVEVEFDTPGKPYLSLRCGRAPGRSAAILDLHVYEPVSSVDLQFDAGPPHSFAPASAPAAHDRATVFFPAELVTQMLTATTLSASAGSTTVVLPLTYHRAHLRRLADFCRGN